MDTTFWNDAILEPLRRFVDEALAFLMNNFLAMLVVLLLGILAAYAVRLVLRVALTLVRFDRFCERRGVTAGLRTAGIQGSPSQAVARLAYWLVMFVFLMLSLSALSIPPMNDLVSRVFLFLPQVIAALVILVLGYLVGSFLQRAALLAAVNAGLTRARALATSVQVLALLFTVAVALEQLGIGRNIVLATFSIAFASVGLAAALAFGYAARDLAKTILERELRGPERGGLGEISHL
ncbi:MAG: mechanosensitive ion channel family protein [Gemmatimonadales bacterium]